ncbi:phosphate propanoyltransferase [bacterium]|nr:phosphate propanoyltransferase [bacterium]
MIALDEPSVSATVEQVVRRVLARSSLTAPAQKSTPASTLKRVVPIGISSRHLHLQPDHVEALFGRGHKLTRYRDLMQPGQFAAKEIVTLIGPKGRIMNVRVLGPERKQTQIEAAVTDLRALGVMAPLRLSGDLAGSAPLKIRGPCGLVQITEGLIIAQRHLHISSDEAARYGVKTGDRLRIRTRGNRPVVFEDVIVRAGGDYRMEFHLDTDEGNAAGVTNGDLAEIL